MSGGVIETLSARLLPVGDQVRVLASRRPLSLERVALEMPEGRTIEEIIVAAGLNPRWPLRVFLDGELVGPDLYARVRPHRGRLVTIRVVPTGGSGGDSNKTLRTLLQIVVVIAAIYITVQSGGTLGPFGAALAGAAFSVGGMLAINALLPIPGPPTPNQGTAGPNFSISGIRNALRPNEPIAKNYGRHRIFPAFGARPFTEIVGDDQFLRCLFIVGLGPLLIEDIRIGVTPIEQYGDVQIEVRQGYLSDAPVTLYTNQVFEDPVGVRLSDIRYETRTTRADTDEISVDVAFPRGIYSVGRDGVENASAHVGIDYRPVQDPPVPFIHQADIILDTDTTTPIRRGHHWTVARGTYEVRLVRGDPETSENEGGADAAFWTALRSIKNPPPISYVGGLPPLAMIAVRIRGTDQLQGVLDTLNCVATAILPDWDGAAWTPRATRSPAAAYRDVAQGPGNARPKPDSRLNLAELQDWSVECAAAGRTFDAIYDFRTKVRQALMDIAAVGRGAMSPGDGRYTVIRDVPQTAPVAHITPRTSWGYSGSKAFVDMPHALKIPFKNEERDWQDDERIVYDDGYDATNASKFETTPIFFGATSPAQVWKLGRYHLGAARLRPEIHSLSQDIENLRMTRGDLVLVTHDAPSFGLGAGRIKSVALNGGGAATAITVDEKFLMEPGLSYVVRIRRSDASDVIRAVTTVVGEQTTLTFTATLTPPPEVGDLVMFGYPGEETVPLLVKAIHPGPDLTARLTFVDHAPELLNVDSGPIPPFDSHISTQGTFSLPAPLPPVVDGIVSDESVLIRQPDGQLLSRIVISLHFLSGPTAAASLDVRYRKSGSEARWTQLTFLSLRDALDVSISPVEDGASYDIRLRAISSQFIPSTWVDIIGHVIVGKSTPPRDVVTMLLEGAILKWTYPAPATDFAGFRLRRHFSDRRVWNDAQPLHDGLLTDTSYPLLIVQPGTATYLLKAIDAAGNESVNPAVVVTNLGDAIIENIILSTDYKAAGFPGVITNGVIQSGNLKATETPDLYWVGGDEELAWTDDDSELYWDSEFHALEYLASVLPDADKVPATLLLDLTVDALAWSLDYRLSGAALYWSGADGDPYWDGTDDELFWGNMPTSDWFPWPGLLETVSRQVYEFRLRTLAGPVQGIVSGYVVKLDVPDIRESIEDFVVAATGTVRLPITKDYRAIKGVTYSVQTDGNGAAYMEVLDKDPDLGPSVVTRNPAGTRVQGLIDVPDLVGY